MDTRDDAQLDIGDEGLQSEDEIDADESVDFQDDSNSLFGDASKSDFEDLDDDYEFLFGAEHVEKPQRAGGRTKDRKIDIEKRIHALGANLDGEENEQFDTSYDYLLESCERRKAVEYELLQLFSGLVTREQFMSVVRQDVDFESAPPTARTVDSSAPAAASTQHSVTGHSTGTGFYRDAPTSQQSATQGGGTNVGVDKASERLMKHLIRLTFRGKQPEGRFGNLTRGTSASNVNVSSSTTATFLASANASGTATSAPTKDAPKTRVTFTGPATSHAIRTVNTISRDALANLRDLNTLLSRERGSDYQELDSVPLYKHSRYATLYIFHANLIHIHVLPLCTLLQKSTDPETSHELTCQVVYLLYQVTQPPSEAWFKYWSEAQLHYGSMAKSKDTNFDDEIKGELRHRGRVVSNYIQGLARLKQVLVHVDFWHQVADFRIKLQHLQQNDFFKEAQKIEIDAKIKLRDDLANERDELVEQLQDTNIQVTGLSRLRKDHEAIQSKRKRLKEVKAQLYATVEAIDRLRQVVATTKAQTIVHIKTTTYLVAQVLGISGPGYNLVLLLQQVGLISLLREQLMASFYVCKSAFVTDESTANVTTHPAYVTESQRADLWEKLRLIHGIFTAIDIGKLLQITHGLQPPPLTRSVAASALATTSSAVPHAKMNDSLEVMMRINPNLAREMLKQRRQVSDAFKMDERFTPGWLKKSSYIMAFKSSNAQMNTSPLAVETGFFGTVSRTGTGASEYVKKNALRLQGQIHELLGIDVDFQNYPETNSSTPFELALVTKFCLADLARDTQESYLEPDSIDVVLDIVSWTTIYLRCLYEATRAKHLANGIEPISESSLLLALRNVIGTSTETSTRQLWNYQRGSASTGTNKVTQFGVVAALKTIYSELVLMHLVSNSAGLHQLGICKTTLAQILEVDIRRLCFNIVRNFKPSVQSDAIFSLSLAIFNVLYLILSKLGPIECTKKINSSFSLDRDYDDVDENYDLDGVEGSDEKMKYQVDAASVYSARQRDDVLYNGRVVYNCLVLLVRFKSNCPSLNDLLISHLERVPKPLLYDVKYLYAYDAITRDRCVWQNCNWRWIGEFFMEVLQGFFDSWLCVTNPNRFLVTELLFNKTLPSVVGVFRPCGKEHIEPIIKGYHTSAILSEMLKNPTLTAFEASRQAQGQDKNEWDPEQDKALLKYWKQFSYLQDPYEYIADVMGRRTLEVKERLEQLLKSQKANADVDDQYIGDGNIRAAFKALVDKFQCDAISAIAELCENVSQALEMKRLGGTDVVCEVQEPLCASQEMLNSVEFTKILGALGIRRWLLPSDTTKVEKQLEILQDPDLLNQVVMPSDGMFNGQDSKGVSSTHDKMDENAQSSKSARQMPSGLQQTDYSSRDIAKLILDVYETAGDGINLVDVIQDAIACLETAMEVSKASYLYKGELEPQAREALAKLLKIGDLTLDYPLVVYQGVQESTAAATDRLIVALNLAKIPKQRLEYIATKSRIVQAHATASTSSPLRAPTHAESSATAQTPTGVMTDDLPNSNGDEKEMQLDANAQDQLDALYTNLRKDTRTATHTSSAVTKTRRLKKQVGTLHRRVLNGICQELLDGSDVIQLSKYIQEENIGKKDAKLIKDWLQEWVPSASGGTLGRDEYVEFNNESDNRKVTTQQALDILVKCNAKVHVGTKSTVASNVDLAPVKSMAPLETTAALVRRLHLESLQMAQDGHIKNGIASRVALELVSKSGD